MSDDSNSLELDEITFRNISRAFFIAFPHINAITISNMLDGSQKQYFFTFWGKEDVVRIAAEKTNTWGYESPDKGNVVFGRISLFVFGFILKTKGVYAFRRSEFKDISNSKYRISDKKTFLIKFAPLFFAIRKLDAVNFRQENRVVFGGCGERAELNLDSMSFVTSDKNYSIDRNEASFIISLVLMLSKKIKKEKEEFKGVKKAKDISIGFETIIDNDLLEVIN